MSTHSSRESGQDAGRGGGESKPRARAIIVEDEWVVARDLQQVLEEIGVQVIRLVRRPEELDVLLDELAPDLLLLDIDLGTNIDGITLAESIRQRHDCPLLFVSGHTEPATLARLRTVEASGFVVKPFSRPQLEAAVEIALAHPRSGRSSPSTPAVSKTLEGAQGALREIARVLAGVGALPSETPTHDWRRIPGLDDLSPREAQVLDALLAHRRPPQIAEELGISPHTVRNHLKSIYAKCGVRSQTELLRLIVEAS